MKFVQSEMKPLKKVFLAISISAKHYIKESWWPKGQQIVVATRVYGTAGRVPLSRQTDRQTCWSLVLYTVSILTATTHFNRPLQTSVYLPLQQYK